MRGVEAGAGGGGGDALVPSQQASTAGAATRGPSEASPGGTGRTPTIPSRRSSSNSDHSSDGTATTNRRSELKK